MTNYRQVLILSNLKLINEWNSLQNEIKSFLFINKTPYNVPIAFTAVTTLGLIFWIEAHFHEQ